MFCTKCGSELREQDRFCSACGAATARGAAPRPREPANARLSRPMSEAKIAGVCAGFARYFGVGRDAGASSVGGADGVSHAVLRPGVVHRRLDRDAERSSDGSGARARHELAHLVLYFLQPIRALQHLARLAAVRGADDALMLHHVENASGAAVA